MINSVNDFFVIADSICDYIPLVSTVSNLIDLFQKNVILSFIDKGTINDSHYFTHLKGKLDLRCVVLLIPLIGNIVIGIYDFANRKYNDKNQMLAAVQENGFALEHASEELKNDKDVVLAAVQQTGFALMYAGAELQEDKDIALTAVKQNGRALYEASEQLKNDRDVVLAAVKQKGHALMFASAELKDDNEVVRAAVNENSAALKYASQRLREELTLTT